MSASGQITAYIDRLGDWRGTLLARIRSVVGAASPDLVEGWKWSTPVWICAGNVLGVGAFKDHVKATRAIDLAQGDRLDEAGLTQLVRAAVALDRTSTKTRSKGSR